MKKLTKIVSLLFAVAICVLLPDAAALTASAEEPVTYYVKYLADNNEWRFQLGSAWNDQGYHRELYYLNQDIKDGDIVVVDGNSSSVLEIPVHLSNLTFYMGTSAVVTAKSIDECFVLRDCVCAINGDTSVAYVYDSARCTFNNNVGTLNVLNDATRNDSLLRSTVTVGGTVDHLIGHDGAKLHYELYSFAAGKLVVENGDVKTDTSLYSTTAPAAGSTQNTSSSADEYDDVPKTGDSTLIFWLLGISAICFAGRYSLKKAH